jgi:hypothetical protein
MPGRNGGTVATLLAATMAGALVLAPSAPAQDAGAAVTTIKQAARKAAETQADAIVSLKCSIKISVSMGGQEMNNEDQQLEVAGTVIDASGLTVLSEGAIDPTSMLGDQLEAQGLTVKTTVGEVKLVLKDGKEIPARIVLRDKDLDLAFAAPEEKGLKLPFVSMEKGATAAALDDIFILGRLGRSLDRAPSISLSTIAAVVKKPRTFYVTNASNALASTGCPAFDAAGKPLGIFLQRRAAATGGSGLMDIINRLTPVILPCDDVKEVAVQAAAAAAKPPEKPLPETTPTEKDAPKEGGEGESSPGKAPESPPKPEEGSSPK